MPNEKREKKQREAELRAAGSELFGIRCELTDAYRNFDSLSDPDLMDACIFEINALRARYSCILKQTRTRFM